MMLQSTTTTGSNGLDRPVAGLVHHSKRKAAETPEGNERLSKRLSLLNLEHSGAKLYVPVERPANPVSTDSGGFGTIQVEAPVVNMSDEENDEATDAMPAAANSRTSGDDEDMRLDNTKYKVYIYDIDNELADENDNDDEGTAAANMAASAVTDSAGRLVFLPDIAKHLRVTARDVALTGTASAGAAATMHPKLAVPRPILPNKDGELAGMQLVLYNDPSSLSVTREKDSVRQAILDARARIRERQQSEKEEREREAAAAMTTAASTWPDDDIDAMEGTPISGMPTPLDASIDPDAMDID